MTDRIFLERIRLRCKIGTTARERRNPQEVLVGLSLFLPLKDAGKSDDLKKTANYREVMERVSSFVSGGEFNLLESLAEGVASLLLDSFPVEGVAVKVYKAKYSSEPLIGIEIERGKVPWSRP